MKRIHFAVLATFIFTTFSNQSRAESKPTLKGWRPTATKRRPLFRNDAADSKVTAGESAPIFPADPVQRTSAAQDVIELNEERPLFPLRTALQALPAPPATGSKVPPPPKGAPMPKATRNESTPEGTTPGHGLKGETGFSAPFDQSKPQLLEVEDVFSGAATGCDDCGCDDWCHRHCWFRSTCDMPLRHWYCPINHGYYYFRPYNFRHVLQHSQLAPLLGADPRAPYETEMFQKFYADVPGVDKYKVEPLKPLEDDGEKLPNLEELLGLAKKVEKTEGKPKPAKTDSKKVNPPPPPMPKKKP